MKNELRSGVHTVGEGNLHLQFTPVYRRDVFRDSLVWELAVACIVVRAQQLGVFVSAVDCGPDHLHLFVERWKNWSIQGLACELKKYSSRKMREGHKGLFEGKLWGEKFWSSGYFHRTVGVVTKEIVKHYVKGSQAKHWENRKMGIQNTLLNYA